MVVCCGKKGEEGEEGCSARLGVMPTGQGALTLEMDRPWRPIVLLMNNAHRPSQSLASVGLPACCAIHAMGPGRPAGHACGGGHDGCERLPAQGGLKWGKEEGLGGGPPATKGFSAVPNRAGGTHSWDGQALRDHRPPPHWC